MVRADARRPAQRPATAATAPATAPATAARRAFAAPGRAAAGAERSGDGGPHARPLLERRDLHAVPADGRAVDHHMADAGRLLRREALAVGGEVADAPERPRPDERRVEHAHVGVRARTQV